MIARRRAVGRASGLALGLVLATLPLAAVSQTTTVTPDLGASRGVGTIVTHSGNVLRVEGGTLSGANLFHSFSQFSLGSGDIARWTHSNGDAASVNNVINRVTGGEVSRIAGTIDSTGLPNANFFFINPAGIVFSQGARINVPAAAFFSTAGELRFADGARFAVSAPNGSTLSMAAPESFGFLGGQGSIEVTGAGENFAPSTALLSFSGADVRVSNTKLQLAQRTTVRGLDLIGVGPGPQAVNLINPLTATATGAVQVRRSAFAIASGDTAAGAFRVRGGQVELDTVNIISDTGGQRRGGDVRVVADQLRIYGESSIGTSARAQGAAGDIDFVATDIDINGGILFNVSITGAAAGRISMTADNLVVRGGATLASTNSAGGRGGDIALSAKTLQLDSVTAVSSALGNGGGGDLILDAPAMQLINTNVIATSLGLARPGDVHVNGDVIEISGGSYGALPGANSDSGALTINAASSLYALGAAFSASSSSDNGAGSITIRSPEILFVQSRISADNFGDGGGGMVLVEADNLVFDEVMVRVGAYGAAGERPGLARFKAAGDLQLFNSIITSNTNGQARGGIIEIAGRDVLLEDSQIRSDTIGLAEGDAGRVAIKADNALLVRNGVVTSGSNSFGKGGDVVLEAPTITLDTGAGIRADTLGPGDAGEVTVKAGSLTILESASITSRSRSGAGNAGKVSVEADTIKLIDGRISSGTDSQGDAGIVSIRVGDLILDGDRRDRTFITSETLGQGDAGGIFIDAKSIDVRNGAYVSSDTFESGDAGSVTIRAGTLTVGGGGYISSDSAGEGDAGNIAIIAGDMKIGDLARVSTSSRGEGEAGELAIKAKVLIVDGGLISSASERGAAGASGALRVEAETLSLVNRGAISTVSHNPLPAGQIEIVAGALSIDGGRSLISSENLAGDLTRGGVKGQVGDAGSVAITAANLTVSNGGRITTNSFGGAAGGISITIPRPGLLVLEGADMIGSIQTSSGAGTGGRITITNPLAVISNGGAILALGQLSGANVTIRSRYFINSTDRLNTVAVDGDIRLETGLYDVSSGTVNRDISVLDASKVLQGQCPAARSTGVVSQLITRPVGPYVRDPGFAAPPAGTEPVQAPRGACT